MQNESYAESSMWIFLHYSCPVSSNHLIPASPISVLFNVCLKHVHKDLRNDTNWRYFCLVLGLAMAAKDFKPGVPDYSTVHKPVGDLEPQKVGNYPQSVLCQHRPSGVVLIA